ncbi:hypothetical protein [uncultured Muribaculum sp.]|uniref:hypothetical protein n=1 Tax=uncultured Muribaculum sp. TaxID=1918613 RepID=UPI0025D12C00|nr:hypothetical protein [uncultured Muribaculum sp.]
MPETIVTTKFRISPSAYASAIMRQWASKWWWAVALLPLCSISAAFASADIRYLMLALVLVCLVIPPAMLIVYYYHALSPHARLNIPLHSVACDGIDLTIDFFTDENDEDASEKPVSTTVINMSDICGTIRSSSAIGLLLDKKRPAPMLLIPYSSFQSSTALQRFIELLKESRLS